MDSDKIKDPSAAAAAAPPRGGAAEGQVTFPPVIIPSRNDDAVGVSPFTEGGRTLSWDSSAAPEGSNLPPHEKTLQGNLKWK